MIFLVQQGKKDYLMYHSFNLVKGIILIIIDLILKKIVICEIKMEKYSARLLSPSVVGDCFNMKWQPLEVALANVHG
jgi:hypothetical protein